MLPRAGYERKKKKAERKEEEEGERKQQPRGTRVLVCSAVTDDYFVYVLS
jgi:hypothetical protein